MVKRNDYIKIPFDSIICDREFNPRTDYSRIEELAASISEEGLLQPLGVCPQANPHAEGTKYFLAYGFRRFAAIELIRKKQGIDAFADVPVVVKDTNLDDLRMVNFQENLERENLSAAEIGKAIRSLVNCGYKQEEIAQRLGRPQSWVSTHYKLDAKLSKKAKDAFASGVINTEQALNIAELPAEEQKALVEQVEEAETRSEARKLIKDATKETRKRKQATGLKRPTAKNLKQYVSDVSFDAESAADEVTQAFYEGMAAMARVALGEFELEKIDPDGTYADTSYHAKDEKSEEAPAEADSKPKGKGKKGRPSKKGSQVSNNNAV